MKFQEKGRGLIISLFKTLFTKAFPSNSESENDTSHLIFNVKYKTRQKVITTI